jgi:hypothetical protein
MNFMKDLTMFALVCDRLASADTTTPIPTLSEMVRVSSLLGRAMTGQVDDIDEIDEALIHAWTTKKNQELSQRQRDIVDRFINDLLDTRLELM